MSMKLHIPFLQVKHKMSGIIAEHVSTLVLYELEIDSISMIAQSFTFFTSPVIV